MEIWNLFYDYFLIAMAVFAGIVFILLQFVTVPYGMTFHNRWGISVSSNLGWMIMELLYFTIVSHLLFLFGLHIKPFNFFTFSILFFSTALLATLLHISMLMRGTSKNACLDHCHLFLFQYLLRLHARGMAFLFFPGRPISYKLVLVPAVHHRNHTFLHRNDSQYAC